MVNYYWTEGRYLKLIKEYKARPFMWNPRCGDYKNHSLRKSAWKEIDKAIGGPSPFICQYKMRYLIKTYKNEKRNIVNSIRSIKDPASPLFPRSEWFGFHAMAFIVDTLPSKSERQALKTYYKAMARLVRKQDVMEPSVMEPSEMEPGEMEPGEMEPVDTEPGETEPGEPESCEMETDKREQGGMDPGDTEPCQMEPCQMETDKRELGMIEPCVVEPREMEPGVMPKELSEEIQSFAVLIASKLKTYSKVIKRCVHSAIVEILIKADRGDYEIIENQQTEKIEDSGVEDDLALTSVGAPFSLNDKSGTILEIEDTDSDTDENKMIIKLDCDY